MAQRVINIFEIIEIKNKQCAGTVGGGNLLSPILILVVLPVLIDAFSRQGRKSESADARAEANT